ncbi:hypothetical protein R3P38DRAFT_1451748 [Favolaschia claudopus]|uniref:PIN domain-containing protein n=1 Tax=Favolaschia claudopus TaxID=2862362 RepID=A0AAW0AMK3_9AGAR
MPRLRGRMYKGDVFQLSLLVCDDAHLKTKTQKKERKIPCACLSDEIRLGAPKAGLGDMELKSRSYLCNVSRHEMDHRLPRSMVIVVDANTFASAILLLPIHESANHDNKNQHDNDNEYSEANPSHWSRLESIFLGPVRRPTPTRRHNSLVLPEVEVSVPDRMEEEPELLRPHRRTIRDDPPPREARRVRFLLPRRVFEALDEL